MGNYFKIKSQLLILKHVKISVYRVLGGLVTGVPFFTTVCNYGGCEVRSVGLVDAFRPSLRFFRGFPPFISSIVTFTGA